VIVPTHRRPEKLSACLESLADLDYPPDRFEIVVVDDGGDAPLDPIVAPVRGRRPLTLIQQSRRGPAGARNAGAERARGELLAFTDDDCRPTRGWLRRLAEKHARDPRSILGGHTRNALVRNPFATTSQMIIDAGYERHNRDRSDARFLTTNNLAVPADGFREIGGFDADFVTSEDRDLCDRWVASGRRMRYLPEAIVEHAHDLTLRSFWRQHFAYGGGARRFHGAHARRSGQRIRIEPLYYLGMHRRAWQHLGVARKLELQFALVVWHAANLAGYLFQRQSAGTAPGSSSGQLDPSPAPGRRGE
jgi:GT2 family glycosyltransferase